MDLISVIVPFLNEEDCIINFCDFIDNIAKDNKYNVEIIFVDDGSTDNTLTILKRYDFINVKNVKLISLSRNYGSHAAIQAGLLHSTGDYCTFICADLQEPSDMIDVMYNNIIEGYDVIYIEKERVSVSLGNRIFSLMYSALIRKYAVKNYGSGGINNIMLNNKLLCYLNKNIEINSSIHLQILNAGFKSKTIGMKYNERAAGKSKWTLSKKIKLFIDSFVAFSFMPIRMVSIVGIIIFFIGLGFAFYILIGRLLNPDFPVMGYPTIASILSIGFGITNISLGIIAEYLWRTFDAARKRPSFIISEILDLKTIN